MSSGGSDAAAETANLLHRTRRAAPIDATERRARRNRLRLPVAGMPRLFCLAFARAAPEADPLLWAQDVLEDPFHVTSEGEAWCTPPRRAIDDPFPDTGYAA